MGFSRQEYWSGLPFLSPGNLPNPGIEPRSPAFQADTLTSEPPGKSKKEKHKALWIYSHIYSLNTISLTSALEVIPNLQERVGDVEALYTLKSDSSNQYFTVCFINLCSLSLHTLTNVCIFSELFESNLHKS